MAEKTLAEEIIEGCGEASVRNGLRDDELMLLIAKDAYEALAMENDLWAMSKPFPPWERFCENSKNSLASAKFCGIEIRPAFVGSGWIVTRRDFSILGL